MDRYFEAVRVWGAGSFDHIMALPPRRLAQYVAQIERIVALEHRNG